MVTYAPAVFTLVGTLIVCIVLIAVAKKIVPNLRLHSAVRVTLRNIINKPVVVAVAGFGLLQSWQLFLEATTISTPLFFDATTLELVVDLAILVATIYATGVIIKKVTPYLIHTSEADQVLVYSVYVLGIIIFGYILLASPLGPRIATDVWSVINFLTGVFLTYLAVYVVNVAFKRYTATIELKGGSFKTTIQFLRRIALSIVAIVGVSIATFVNFPSLGAAIASIFVAAGFVSIVVGLAAQTSLSNIIAGVVISTSQPFKIGDALSYAGEWAWVEDIKLTFTILKTWDNRRLVVPNQMFLNSTMINYDEADSTKLCIVYVSITFESDLDKAIEILKDAARKHPDFLPQGDLPIVHLMDLGGANGVAKEPNSASGVSLRLLSRAKDQSTNFQMSKDLLYIIKQAFDANGIDLASPRRQVFMDSADKA